MIWIGYFIIALVSFFVIQDDKKPTMRIDRMIDLCKEYGAEDYAKKVKEVNLKIELLKVARKGKVDARQDSKLAINYSQSPDKPVFIASFKSNKEKKQAIESLIQEILEKKQVIFSHPKMAIPEMDWDRIRPFGVPPYGQVMVDQVIGNDSFHGKFCPIDNSSKRMKFSAVGTDLIVDGQLLKITRPLVIEGTSSYTTVIGSSNTIYAWRGVSDEELSQVMKAIEENRPAKMKQVWIDNTGNFRVEAELVSFDGKMVKLEKADGKIVELELTRLAKEDQLVIQKALGLEPL